MSITKAVRSRCAAPERREAGTSDATHRMHRMMDRSATIQTGAALFSPHAFAAVAAHIDPNCLPAPWVKKFMHQPKRRGTFRAAVRLGWLRRQPIHLICRLICHRPLHRKTRRRTFGDPFMT